MSIINDAIKKARKEFEIKSNRPLKTAAETVSSPAIHRPEIKHEMSDSKWTIVVVISLVVVASLLGSLFLYNHVSSINRETRPSFSAAEAGPSVYAPPPKSSKNILSVIEPKEAIFLNGIVYEATDRWAVINDNIAREGDRVPGGTLSVIERNFVEIAKDNGEKIVLELR